MATQEGNESVSFTDSLAALLLQIKAFNTRVATSGESSTGPAPAPVELQIDNSEAISDKTLAEQIVFLADLVTTLQTKSEETDVRLADLEPEILASQQALQQLTVEQDRLVRAQEVARETYLTLTRKLDEARIAAQEENSTLQVGSYAAVPESPIGPRRLFTTAVVGVLGLVVGVLVVFFVDFWRRSGKPAQDKVAPDPPNSGPAPPGNDVD
jgi:hypothetical protein